MGGEGINYRNLSNRIFNTVEKPTSLNENDNIDISAISQSNLSQAADFFLPRIREKRGTSSRALDSERSGDYIIRSGQIISPSFSKKKLNIKRGL